MVALHKDAHLADQITPEVSLERYALPECDPHAGGLFRSASSRYRVVVGNDQMEIFGPISMPAPCSGAITWKDTPRSPEFLAKLNPAVARAEADRTPSVYTEYPCSPELGKHVIQSVVSDGFDVSQLTKLPTGSIGSNAVPHAYGFVYRRIMRDKVPMQVPVFVNTLSLIAASRTLFPVRPPLARRSRRARGHVSPSLHPAA
jgi:hypothetical protein